MRVLRSADTAMPELRLTVCSRCRGARSDQQLLDDLVRIAGGLPIVDALSSEAKKPEA